MKFLFLICVIAACSLTPLEAQTTAVCFEDSLYSPSMASTMKFNVILPPGYDETSERYTTIYLLHGLWGSYLDWVSNTGLVAYASKYPFIIITPEGGNGWWTNSPTVKHALYEDFIIKDLIPGIDRRYRTLATRHGRAIAGLSMGGYGAFKFAMKYPGMFFYAASFSGAFSVISSLEEDMKTMDPQSVYLRSRIDAFGAARSEHWLQNDVMALADSAQTGQLPYLYLSVGHSDRYTDALLAVGAKLRKKGAAFEMHESIGAHTWLFWDQEVRTLLEKVMRYDPLNVK